MSSISLDNRISSILCYSNIKNILLSLEDQLERSQKALNEFLEEKRNKFARFYFLGDDDLLEILGTHNLIQDRRLILKLFKAT
jgi:dynein heavy chain 2, cytosolic